MFQNKKSRKIISILLLFIFVISIFSGCKMQNAVNESAMPAYTLKDQQSAQTQLEELTHQLFLDTITPNTITYHYTLQSPEKLQLSDIPVGWGNTDLDSLGDTSNLEAYLQQLNSINRELLNSEQQLTFDILYEFLKTELSYADLYLYSNVFQPGLGLHANLPILLSEYRLNNKADVEDYLNLLILFPDYMDFLLDIETKRSDEGLFMADFVADKTIQECSDFIKHPKDNLLISAFQSRIQNVKGLTASDINDYKKRNTDCITQYVIPAYENIISKLQSLKGTGKNENGLADFPEGKRYYEYLLKSTTGTSKKPKQLVKLLEKNINDSIRIQQTLFEEKPELYQEYQLFLQEKDARTPEKQLNQLVESIHNDFPYMQSVKFTLKNVPSVLEKSMGPAFYLSAPIDNKNLNTIYMNQNKSASNNYPLFIDLAHEGYPGHLFQTAYFNQKSDSNLRKILNFSGYTEGWATYAQQYAYKYGHWSQDIQDLATSDYIFTLCLQTRIDIGVNYDGWSRDKTTSFLKSLFSSNMDSLQEFSDNLFESAVATPGNSLKYCIGYLELLELKDAVKTKLGNLYTDKNFHEFILTTGPCLFDTLNNQVKVYDFNQN